MFASLQGENTVISPNDIYRNFEGLKVRTQDEQLNLWQKHFKKLHLTSPNMTEGASITQVVPREWNIKKGLLSVEELQGSINCMENGKPGGLDGIPAEGWKLEDFSDVLLDS